jgi:tetratricopeptide (TPR) repeat protein
MPFMSDVFISYSRLDKDFVGQLRDALTQNEQDVWIDWEDIPPSQSWWNEIQKGIAKANNFVLVLSPNSMSSPICQMEIEYARELKKRIIPVLHQDYDHDVCISNITQRLARPEEGTTREIWAQRHVQNLFSANEGELKHINYFFFKPDVDFATRFADLFKIIRTDYAHKEQHTTLELRAREWERRKRDTGFLLLDNEWVEAQNWLQASAKKDPVPTDLQRAYIQASEKRNRQLRNIRRTSIVGTGVAILAILATIGAIVIGTTSVNASLAQLATATVAQGQAQQQAELVNTQIANANVALATATVAQGQAQDSANLASTAQNEALAMASTAVLAQQNAQQQAELANTQIANANVALATATVAQGQAQDSANLASTAQNEALAMASTAVLAQQNAQQQAELVNTQIANANIALATATVAQGQALLIANEAQLQSELVNTQIANANVALATATVAQGQALLIANEAQLQSELVNTQIANANSLLATATQALINVNTQVAVVQLTSTQVVIEQDIAKVLADTALLSIDPALQQYNVDLLIERYPDQAQAYVARATILVQQGNFFEAIDDYTQAIALNPQFTEAYYNRGAAYLAIGSDQNAFDDYTTVIRLRPEWAEPYFFRGEVRMFLNDFEGAIEDYSQALALQPDNLGFHASRGIALNRLGRYAEAIADFDFVLSISNMDAEVWFQRGLAYAFLADTTSNRNQQATYVQNAGNDLRQAQSLGYELPPEWQNYLNSIP